MKPFYFIPLADYPMDRPESSESIERAVISVASLIWALQRLAELAGLLAAIAFYFSLLTSEPTYLGWLPLLTYLGQGIYLRRADLKKSAKPSDLIDRGRGILSILSWPVHRSLRAFHDEVIRADERYPKEIIDREWIHWTLLFVVLQWGINWMMGFMVPFLIGIFIDQAILLPLSRG